MDDAVTRTIKQLVADRLLLEALLDAMGEPVARMRRVIKGLPYPLDLDSEITLDDEGWATIDPAVADRLKGFAEEVVALLTPDTAKEPTP